jgi:hypothetical protein
MKLSEIRKHLKTAAGVNFQLPSGEFVPEHFHITEVGMVTKHFIDCGGTERLEKVANFQLWNANDFEHRLKPGKLLRIIELSQNKLGMGDLEIEVEYQSDTIGRYDLAYNGTDFLLLAKHTACLAGDKCGIPPAALINNKKEAICTPGSGCC